MSNDPSGASPRRRGCLIVISGPSGAGKTSICRGLIESLPNTMWSVSVTTRLPREGDISGESYEFVSETEFRRREVAGELLESALYVGHHYGTPRAPVEAALDCGQNVVLEIDVQGGMQIAEKMPASVRVFVLPPDMAALQVRLEGRNTEALEQLKKRLAEAEGEIATAQDSGCYPHMVTNDTLDTTIERVKQIVEQEIEQP